MTSTRRIFRAQKSQLTPSTRRSAGGQDRTVEGGATTRALAANTQRLERQQGQQGQSSLAIYRGGGEFSTLGADGGYRPRGDVTSGGRPIGAVVPSNGGLVGGMPAPFGDDGRLQALQERVGEVAQQLGPQVGAERPTPNEIDTYDPETDVFPRYRGDQYFQSTTKTTWQWQASDGAVPGKWIELPKGNLLYGEGNPNGTLADQSTLVPWQSKTQYYELLTGRLFVSTPNDSDSPVVKWLAASRVTWDDGLIASSAAGGFYAGDIYQGPTDHGIEGAEGGMLYRLNDVGSWIPQFTCCEPPPPPAALCLPLWYYTHPGAVFIHGIANFYALCD